MKNFIIINRNKYQCLILTAMVLLMNLNVNAQIGSNAVNADPSAKSITQVPLGSSINGTAVIRYKFTNEATSVNATGQIPVNSVRITISFPGTFAYHSINSIPKFIIEDAETAAYGVVHLVNNALILEGEVLDLQLNVIGTATGAGSVTFNVDRTTPIIVANVQTSNDNASATFTTNGILPLKLLSFDAQKQGCNATLRWKTTNETKVDHFEVEMSIDGGTSYTNTGTVPASTSNSMDKLYNYNIVMQSSKSHLFRLKMVDKEGHFTYSYIVRINSGCSAVQDHVSVYPSPARSNIILNTTDASLFNSKAPVMDVNGKTQMSFVITGSNVNVAVNKLPPGIYIIRLANGTNVRFMKE